MRTGLVWRLLQDTSFCQPIDLCPTWGLGFPGGTRGKESACQCRRCKRHGLNPWVGKIPWGMKRQPTPVFLPRKLHEKGELAGYSPWGHKELDTTEHMCSSKTTWGLTLFFCFAIQLWLTIAYTVSY